MKQPGASVTHLKPLSATPPVYRKTVWFKMAYPLKPADMSRAFKGAKKRRARRVRDKNNPGSWIELPCSFERTERDGNYIVNVTLVHQIRARSDMEYQRATDNLALVFLLGERILVAMGRDGIEEAVEEVSRMLYPDANEDVFLPVQFGLDSVVNAIRRLRDANPRSWCHSFGGRFDASKYKGKRTLDFSKDPGECILDDGEAADAIRNATSLSPKYKFYSCTQLSQTAYDQPKSISFSARYGTVSVSAPQEFEDLYGLVSGFLARELEVSAR